VDILVAVEKEASDFSGNINPNRQSIALRRNINKQKKSGLGPPDLDYGFL